MQKNNWNLSNTITQNKNYVSIRDLSQNQLEIIGKKTFKGASQIKVLQLDNNRLTCVDDVAINGLKDLEVL